ncbi:MAG: DNA repair protein RadC [Bacteroidales bacterium]|nr:DNA repair protein RadC [Bacteroidales bacterium]MBN2755939.1 DNA repair protein RadC [Bacteroidales bacterium]
MADRLSIKNWAIEDRPREKLLLKGINSLSDAELIAILISSGSFEETAVELSKRIISSVDNNLNQLGKLSIKDLQKFKGIGQAKAISIVAAMELGRRRKLSEIIIKENIQSSEQAYEIFNPVLEDLPHEEFWIAFLNRANKVIAKTRISQGGIAGTVIDVKIIMKLAIENLASGIILCHNHPSGNKKPSNEDIKITNKLIEAGKLLDISVLDHIIIANSSYFSFADQGLINK